MPPKPSKPKQRVSSTSSSGSATISSQRPPESQIEVLYNTAVQSFVRRDHVKTQAVLSRLLASLETKQDQVQGNEPAWYDLDSDVPAMGDEDGEGQEEIDEWMIKTLKLSISSLTSLYADPPHKTTTLPSEITNLLPPIPPNKLLGHLRTTCNEYLRSPILPPQIISTLLLASLKLRPSPPALDFAHHLSEEWITALPDQFILSISPQSGSSKQTKDAKKRKKVESAREGYLKVVELFVGEVLSREGEWEMARGFLDGEGVMGSKRKEALYKHLRTLQSTPLNTVPTPSPSSSLVLPSSGSSSRSRSRSGSNSTTSSSSSERTARPNTTQAQLGLQRQSQGIPLPRSSSEQGKGKGKAKEEDPSQIENYNPASPSPSNSIPRIPTRDLSRTNKAQPPTSGIHQLLSSILPPSLHHHLSILLTSNLSYLALPIPLLILLTLLIRRRRRSRPTDLLPTPTNSLDDVRNRLRLARVRQRGWWGWIMYYLNWWIGKFAGVWKLGTTITYL
ncbi:hypothetical protein I302_105611 [Kwoniella bestiolae CBS 10118]|uniref:Uncharacterized protein n=1 Tax=Kwoniella bestiolae CBS 10118 TaxID=1296100 RepID=A0A1B9G1N2_9TREE|nr:hypothetical protein I302_04730 [Kwoniella bestiolae CBS 10118]OCF24920.1 hypothetical protein I302_04730 [Kwoniella bestiolae CBS 10118]